MDEEPQPKERAKGLAASTVNEVFADIELDRGEHGPVAGQK
jgi:hypothetical protein